jgi:hypothetical protein
MRSANFFAWECGFNAIFTAELVTRIAVARDKTATVTDPCTIFDAFAVAPFWTSVVTGAHDMDYLRSLRILRLLKLARHYEGTIILHRTLKLSAPALAVPVFFLLLAVTVFSSFIFYAEFYADETTDSTKLKSDFDSIPSAIWFMVVTMTTVG